MKIADLYYKEKLTKCMEIPAAYRLYKEIIEQNLIICQYKFTFRLKKPGKISLKKKISKIY